MRRSLAEMGTPYELYSTSDLDTLEPEKFSFIILLDSYDIKTGRLEKIKSLASSGVPVLSLYAPNFASRGELSVENIRHMTGLTVKESSTSHGDLIFEGEKSSTLAEAPYFEISDKNAEVIARFEDGTVAVARSGNAVYSASPYVPSEILRKIAKEAGAFIYSENPRVYTYASNGVIGVYNATDDDAKIKVPCDGTFTDKITDSDFVSRDGILTLPKRSLRAYLLVKK
jgi:hypothetical protein